MLPTTGGSFCPSCGHRVKTGTIFTDGPPTPPLGVPSATPPVSDDKPIQDMDGTILYDLPSLKSSAEMPGPRADSSALDGELRLKSESGADLPPSAIPTAPNLGDGALPSLQPETEPRGVAIGLEDDGTVDPTVVVAESDVVAVVAEDDDDEEPLELEPESEHKEALFLPRCKSCDNVLDLEEIADGECAECRRAAGRGRGRRRSRRPTGPPVRLHCAVSGTLAAVAATWVGVLVIVYAVQSNPDTWTGADFVFASSRGALVVFCLVASILWACEQAWAGGAALALGPVAAAASALMLTSGALLGNPATATAWVLAGAAGAVVALSAALPRKEMYTSSRRGGRRGRRSGRSGRDDGPRSRRSRGKSRFSVNRLRAVLGGVVALVGAGLAGWRFVVAYGAEPKVFAKFGPAALTAGGFGVAALVGILFALWLLAMPPGGRTHVVAILAAVVGGALPVLLMLVAHLVHLVGMGYIDPTGAFALPRGLARLLRLSLPAAEAPVQMAFALKAGVVVGLVAAFGAALFILITKPAARGKGLVGFALAWVLVWGAGFAAALAA